MEIKNLPVSLEYAASSFVHKVYDQLKLIFSQKNNLCSLRVQTITPMEA